MSFKLVVALSGLALSLSAGAGIAAADPDTSVIVNSTCTYPQVQAALQAQNPEVAAELSSSAFGTMWLQNLVNAGPEQREQMVQQAQSWPMLQPYVPVIFQVAGTCSKY